VRECVTAVAPGEVLVIQASEMTPSQIEQWQRHLLWLAGEIAPGVKVLVVPGDAHQVVSLEHLDGLVEESVARILASQRFRRPSAGVAYGSNASGNSASGGGGGAPGGGIVTGGNSSASAGTSAGGGWIA